jgi:hypothetical protein
MRKTIGVSMTALALLFGGAGVCHATDHAAPVPSTVTTLAQETNDDGRDNTGLWGLAGLLGLVGLAGLKRRNGTRATPTTRAANPGATNPGPNPIP